MSSPIDRVLWTLMLVSASSIAIRTSDGQWTTGHMIVIMIFIAALMMKLKKDQMERKAARDPVPGFPSAKGAHWLCGHTLMARQNNRDAEGFLSGHRKVYKDAADPKTGVGSLWFFSIPSVTVLQARDVKKIMSTSSYRKSNGLFDAHITNLLGYRNLLSLEGKDWRHFRNAVHKSFTAAAVKQTQQAMHEVATIMISSLRHEIRDQRTKDNNIISTTREVVPLMKCATIDAFGLAFLDRFEFNCCRELQLRSLASSFDHLMNEFVRRFSRPWDPTTFLYNIPTPANREYKRHVNLIRTFIREQVAKGRARIKEETRNEKEEKNNIEQNQKDHLRPKRGSELMTNLIKAAADMEARSDAKEGSHTKLVEKTIQDVFLTLLFGAYETSSITISYALYLIATHPEVEANCLEEIETVMGSRRGKQRFEMNADHVESEVEHGDIGINDLPYINGVVTETLRLFPPGPINRRNLEKPMKLPSNGKILPKGQLINMSVWCVHRSEFNFPRPNAMIPERWVRRRRKRTQNTSDGQSSSAYGRTSKEDNEDEGISAWEKRSPNDDEDASRIIEPGNRDAFFTFAAGARNCVGKVFAIQEVVIMLARLLNEFKFDLISPDYEVRPKVGGFVQRPDDDLPMIIRERL